MQVAEVMSFKRVYKNFLYIIERLTSAFTKMYNAIIDVIALTTNYEAQFFIVIEKFRHNIRLKKMRKKKTFAFSSAFVVNENKKNNKFRNNKFKSSRNVLF